MLDKEKMIEFLESEINSCNIVGTASDVAAAKECQRILDRIHADCFAPAEAFKMEPGSVEFETYRKCVRKEI